MTKKIIEAGLNGPVGSTIAYFFRGDQFIEYDWNADRVVGGPKTITDQWILPLPPEFEERIGFSPYFDAALNGAESKDDRYRHKSYFFRGSAYTRHLWEDAPLGLPEATLPLTAWDVPAHFGSGVDAAFSGKFSRTGKAYFFKDDQYARVNWSGGLDYVHPISQIINMPASFASGVEAAVDGGGEHFHYYGYLFKGDSYIRLNWNDTGGEPFVEGGPEPIVGNWKGLAEMLLAGEAKSKVFDWLWTAVPKLQAYVNGLQTHIPSPNSMLIQSALETHFGIDPLLPVESRLQQIAIILDHLQQVEQNLHRAPDIFHFADDEECAQAGYLEYEKNADGTWKLDASGRKIPSYTAICFTSFQGSVAFTPLFPTFGPLCRAALLLHEMIHFVDQDSTRANQIGNYYVSDSEADRLGIPRGLAPEGEVPPCRYDELPVDIAIYNPDSYASFAQQLYDNNIRDSRYGLGRPNE